MLERSHLYDYTEMGSLRGDEGRVFPWEWINAAFMSVGLLS